MSRTCTLNTHTLHIFLLFLLTPWGIALDISECEVVDLSHALSKDVPLYPIYSPVNFTISFAGPFHDAPFLTYGYFCSYEHISTHMDAPIHFNRDGKPIDKVGFKNLIGEACVVDVRDKVAKDPGYLMTVNDIKEWESKHGTLPKNAILLMSSGQDKMFGDPQKFFGTKNISDPTTFVYPSFARDVGRWLVDNRRIRAYGVDSIGFDVAAGGDFPNHQILLRANIPGMENLANLNKLPPRGATIFLLPAKIKGGTGAWTRAFAVGHNGPTDPCRLGANNNGQNTGTVLKTNKWAFVFALAFSLASF